MEYNEIYFYTTTINGWKPLIKTYNFENIIIQSLEFLAEKECISVFGFAVMPNHVHLIWEMLQPNGKENPATSFKKFTSHAFEKHLKQVDIGELEGYAVDAVNRKYNFWQEKPDFFLLNNEKTIQQKLQYMHENPMQGHWQLSPDAISYPYSSAHFYETGDKNFSFLTDYRDWNG